MDCLSIALCVVIVGFCCLDLFAWAGDFFVWVFVLFGLGLLVVSRVLLLVFLLRYFGG